MCDGQYRYKGEESSKLSMILSEMDDKTVAFALLSGGMAGFA
jgi:hypothetical protein